MSPRPESPRRQRLRSLVAVSAVAAVAAYRQRTLARHEARAPEVADRQAKPSPRP